MWGANKLPEAQNACPLVSLKLSLRHDKIKVLHSYDSNCRKIVNISKCQKKKKKQDTIAHKA